MGDQQGEFSCPGFTAEAKRKKKVSSLLEGLSSEKPWTFCSLEPSQLPFPLYKRVLLHLFCRNLHMAHHDFSPLIAIFCWSEMSPSLPEKYMAICLFQVNIAFYKKSIQLFGCLGSLLGHMRSLLLHAGPFFVTLRLNCPLEGNGNPLQCSCLENPRDGGAWWAAVYGVAQSRTRLKQLSSR